jgi:DNA-binding MarR family transcriptional regulator
MPRAKPLPPTAADGDEGLGGDAVEWVRRHWAAEGLPDADRFATVAALFRLNQAVEAEFDRTLRPFEVNRSMYLVLVTLSLSPGGARKLSYLSRYHMVHQTTVTLIIDQLEKRGLARRQPHPTDRRVSLAALTPAGRALTRDATAALAERGFGLPGVSGRSLDQLRAAMRAVRGAIGDVEEVAV